MKEKIKKYLWVIIIVVFVAGAFYWFEWRPTQIKHDCSWVKVVSPATSAQPAITKEEAEYSRLKYDECVKNMGDRDTWSAINKLASCGYALEERDAIPAQPAKDWWRKASKEEYDFCIHEKGL